MLHPAPWDAFYGQAAFEKEHGVTREHGHAAGPASLGWVPLAWGGALIAVTSLLVLASQILS